MVLPTLSRPTKRENSARISAGEAIRTSLPACLRETKRPRVEATWSVVALGPKRIKMGPVPLSLSLMGLMSIGSLMVGILAERTNGFKKTNNQQDANNQQLTIYKKGSLVN